MENSINEAHEEIKHLDHVAASRLKVVMTVTILVITMLATLAGVMAALWSSKESEAQTERQQLAAAALRNELSATSQLTAADQAANNADQLGWRTSFLYQLSTQVTSQDLAAQLRGESTRTSELSVEAHKQVPPAARAGFAELEEPATRDQAAARAAAQRSVIWLTKNNGALATVSLLALALFLVGLALTIGNRRIQVGFTALAIAMLVVAGGRLAWIAAQPVNAPTEHCIEGYTQGRTAEQNGDAPQARTALTEVTAECPDYSTAWLELAHAYDKKTAAGRHLADLAEQRAVATADLASPLIHIDAGTVALFDHNVGLAADELAVAEAAAPDDPLVLGTLAEFAASQDNAVAANRYLARAVAQITHQGPFYRDNMYFQSLRQDAVTFRQAGWHTKALDELFLHAKEAEASFDAFGSGTPRSTHGATITDIKLLPAKKVGEVDGFYTWTYAVHDLKPGDYVSVRFYSGGDTIYNAGDSSVFQVRSGTSAVGSGVLRPNTTRLYFGHAGRMRMEIYLNGAYQGGASYDTG